MNNIHLFEAAKRKTNRTDLDVYAWEVISSDSYMITMGVPRLKKSGKNKGKKTWDGKFKEVVTRSEEIAEKPDMKKKQVYVGTVQGKEKYLHRGITLMA